jgi:hypothetical protein
VSLGPVTVAIPEGLDFSALRLVRDSDGHVSFAWGPIEEICAANGLDLELFREGPEDNVSALVTAWYFAHRQQGGAPDPVQEDLLAEVQAEDTRGGGFSHQPGRA